MFAVAGVLLSVACAQPVTIRTHTFKQTGNAWVEGGRDPFGAKDGLWIKYDPAGRKVCEGNYKSGVMHGTWRFWFEDGSELSVVYHNGVRVTLLERTDAHASR
jgi:hypothetical protein